MKEIMKITTKQYKTRNTISCSYAKDAFPEIPVATEELKDVFAKLAVLSGTALNIVLTADNDGYGFGIKVRLHVLPD